MRCPLVVGNWKMNGTQQSIAELVKAVIRLSQNPGNIEVVVCAPHVYLSQVAGMLVDSSSDVQLGAQDLSEHEPGAYTGDVAGTMLADVGCHYVIVGHSERRQYHGESNEQLAAKFIAAQTAGLTPIYCVGESLEQREAGRTLDTIAAQLALIVQGTDQDLLKKAVIAYEPVWAIGTGRTASPEQAQEVHSFIRGQLGAAAEHTRILYGGSVNAATAADLFAQPDIDGGLVGGASLDAVAFSEICKAAKQIAEHVSSGAK